MAEGENAGQTVAARVSAMVPSDLSDDVVEATRALGGEAKRARIIDEALRRRGWTEEERAVVSHYAGASRHFHLRSLADYAITVCADRGTLVPSSLPGWWRLPELAETLLEHELGRVLLVAVGVSGSPPEDDWRAEDYANEYGHVWFRAASRQIRPGDHLFAIGVATGGKVLGLFEALSTGDLTEPRNPWEPDRWIRAVAVRALASVPPEAAVSVDGVTTPRKTATLVQTERQRRALYNAVAGRAVVTGDDRRAGAPTEDGPVSRSRALRRPRPFDPDAPPRDRRPGDVALSRDELETRTEKVTQGHHELLARGHAYLQTTGWTQLAEIPLAIDLQGISPAGLPVIFEAKTITGTNEVRQCRAGLAQLLEYRQEHGNPDDTLCLLVDGDISERRADLLDRGDRSCPRLRQRGRGRAQPTRCCCSPGLVRACPRLSTASVAGIPPGDHRELPQSAQAHPRRHG